MAILLRVVPFDVGLNQRRMREGTLNIVNIWIRVVVKQNHRLILGAGGDYPGVIMKHPESGTEMELRLRAPLFSDKGYSIVVANHNNNTAIVMQDSASDDNKSLLSKYLE